MSVRNLIHCPPTGVQLLNGLSAVCFREYLATFKKTVAMHEVFLQRMAAHPVLRTDVNFKVFLEYEPEVHFLRLLICVF